MVTWHVVAAIEKNSSQSAVRVYVSIWAPEFGGRISFPHPEKNESFFLLKWGVQILYIFNEKQTPRSDSANLEPSEPIFCPQILEPRSRWALYSQARGSCHSRWTAFSSNARAREGRSDIVIEPWCTIVIRIYEQRPNIITGFENEYSKRRVFAPCEDFLAMVADVEARTLSFFLSCTVQLVSRYCM